MFSCFRIYNVCFWHEKCFKSWISNCNNRVHENTIFDFDMKNNLKIAFRIATIHVLIVKFCKNLKKNNEFEHRYVKTTIMQSIATIFEKLFFDVLTIDFHKCIDVDFSWCFDNEFFFFFWHSQIFVFWQLISFWYVENEFVEKFDNANFVVVWTTL